MFRQPRSLRPPIADVMRKIGLEPDPWQIEVLESTHPQLLLNCCRQAGKTTVVAMLGLIEALWDPFTRVVLISRSHRQSREILRQMVFFHKLLGERVKAQINAQEMCFDHYSRIISLPCREDTIRGYAHIDLLIIDEAARVPDELYRAVRPMLAVSKGRIICLSTPYGKRGFFWNAWARGGDDWARIEIPADKCPRISAEFLEREKRELGDTWFRQEYFCSFESVEGLVYPDFKRSVVTELPAHVADLANASARVDINQGGLHAVGGIDFGFRNPFAAVWGVRDRDDIIWLMGERYRRQEPLAKHAEHLPREVMWYADPSGANEIASLRCAGFLVRKGNNALQPGIGAVSARLREGTLRVLAGRCPNLLAEAELYRYGTGHSHDPEAPVDEHNHALAAVRYLVASLDATRLALSPEKRRERAA